MSLEKMLNCKWLTLRDKNVILDVYQSKILSSRHLEQFHFKFDENGELNEYSRIICLRRLKKLIDPKYDLLRAFWYGNTKHGNIYHYYIGNTGLDIVSTLLDIPKEQLKWLPKGHNSFNYLENTLGTIDIRFNFSLKGVKINSFKIEQLSRINYELMGNNHILEPDGLIEIELNGKDKIFLLENDRGTESRNIIEKKIQNYIRCYTSQQWSKHFNKFPITLFVVPNETRLKELLKIFNEINTSDLIFLFTTKELMKINILDKIWHLPGGNKLYGI